MAKVDVIIPIYNVRDYLEETIKSVLNQKYKDFRLILVDDKSTDGSSEICDEYVAKDNRVSVIHHSSNEGVSISRDDGFNCGDSEWISFLDADDVLDDCFLEELLDEKIDNDVDIRWCHVKVMNSSENTVELEKTLEDVQYNAREEFQNIYCRGRGRAYAEVLWNKVIKRSLVDTFIDELREGRKDYRRAYLNDPLFSVMLWYYGKKAYYSKKALYNYRVISNSLCHTSTFSIHKLNNLLAYQARSEFMKDKNEMIAYRFQMLNVIGCARAYYICIINQEEDELCREGIKAINSICDRYKNDISVKCIISVRKLFAFISAKLFCYNIKVWRFFHNIIFSFVEIN